MFDVLLDLNIRNPNNKSFMPMRRQCMIAAGVNRQNTRMISAMFLRHEPRPTAPCTVHICKQYNPSLRQQAWDYDNFVFACKGIVDSIADLLVPGLPRGHADHPRHGITFNFSQAKDKNTGIRILIFEPKTDDAINEG